MQHNAILSSMYVRGSASKLKCNQSWGFYIKTQVVYKVSVRKKEEVRERERDLPLELMSNDYSYSRDSLYIMVLL